MKLRTKIKVFLIVWMLIFIVIANTAIYYLFYQTTVRGELERIDNETTSIMTTLAANEQVDPNRLLKAFVPPNGMIRIVNADEKVLHAVVEEINLREVRVAFYPSETEEVIAYEDGSKLAFVSVPYIWENGEVVNLQIVDHLSQLHSTMSTLFFVLIGASLLMIFPALVGGHFLGNFLLRPIHSLIKAMDENRKEGQWNKIQLNKRSKDEFFELSQTYNEMIDRLKESFQRQEEFVSNASHELRTPLSVISSYTQMLKRWGREKPEVFEEAVDSIHSETKRMTQLTEQMLLLARNQKENLQYVPVDIIALTKETIRSISVAYQRKIVLISELQQYILSCDKDKINQVLYILIDNAVKYSEHEIKVYIDKSEKDVIIKVEDFGEGISDSDKDKIFDRFYRVDKARSRQTGGTGLGLAIAYSIVHAHNGEITVTSTKGEGTTFIIKIPN